GSTTTNQVVFPSESLTSGMSVYRLVAPTPTPTPFYPNGLIANNIGFQGNFYADSFDSRLGPYSRRTATDHALIASPPGSSGYTINGTANIYGYVACAVGAVINCGGSAVVGDFNYNVKGIIEP